MNVDKLIGLIALIFMITALAIVISKRSNTVAVFNSLFGGLNALQKTAVSPIK